MREKNRLFCSGFLYRTFKIKRKLLFYRPLFLRQNLYATIYAQGCFPLWTVAFRGHGFSLLEKPTLWGLQTRAVPAGVNGPPLQTTITIVKMIYIVLLPNT